MQNNKLLEQFDNMDKSPMFEINYLDYGITSKDEYVYTYISADEHGIWCDGDVYLAWDDTFSLDEHLQELFDMYIDKLISGVE